MIAVSLILAANLRVITLAEAVHAAETRQPQNRQARAQTIAAFARADQARAPILPQVALTGSYQLTTGNVVRRPSFTPPTTDPNGGAQALPAPTWALFNFFNFGLTLNQYIWDFGQTTGRWRASQATAEAQGATERATHLLVILQVRTAYFAARAQRALMDVAKENLANQDRHLQQITGFVRVGTRPEIDLAQARADRANAVVQLVNAENGYQVAKAQLNQAMGIDGTLEYEVQDESLAPIPGEEQIAEPLLDEALKSRPELLSLERQLRAQELLVSAAKGGYGPSLGASTTASAAGLDFTNLVPNWNVTLNLSWSLFSGLLTRSQIREAHANVDVASAQRDAYRLQLRLEVEQARLQVLASKAALSASGDALAAARDRLRLAEGRYQTGIGNVIELGDAQLALNNAAAQRVQAEYNLSTARAQLLRALGRG